MDREEVKRWLKTRFGHFRTDDDLREELRLHREMLEADGRAAAQLGSTQVVVENVRDQELMTVLEGWTRDFLAGIRSLRTSPVFSLTAILTLAIGIGANTAVFTVLYGLLLRSLPATEPHKLARIGMVNADDSRLIPAIPWRMLGQLQRQQRSFADLSAWSAAAVITQDREGTMRLYHSALVSGNAFDTLGMQAHTGRLITPSDDVRGGGPEGCPVVLSYGFWQDRFGGDPLIVGRTFRVFVVSGVATGKPLMVTVAGVAPRAFQGVWPGGDRKLYLPLQAVADGERLNSMTAPMFFATIGRLGRGVSIDDANAELKVSGKRLLDEFIPPDLRRIPQMQVNRLSVESARTGLPTFFGRTYSTPLYLMQGLVAIVLLLCCVNVSGLMLSKISEREREFAVRTAIGAGRWRLIRQYLTESFALALAGAGLGAVVAWYGSTFLLQFFRDPNMGVWMSVEPDRAVLLVTGAFAVATTLICGIVPAWRAGRSDPAALLKSRTGAARRQTAARALIPVQVAISMVLVTVAALLSGSLTRLRTENTGFDLDHVTIQTPPFNMLPQQGDARLDVYQRMVDRLEQLPAIRSAAVTWYTPMTGIQSTAAFRTLSGASGAETTTLAYNRVGPGYFRTMKTNIVAGREFAKHERTSDLCILNRSAADFLFAHRQPLGEYIRSADEKAFPKTVTCRVIGVAQDAKFASLREPPPKTVYFPLTAENYPGNLVFLINADTKAGAIAAYRQAIQEIAPSIPVVLFATLREQMDAALGSERGIAMLSSVFGALALLLSAVGLYGMLSSSVSQRTGEIGVRVALGAQRNRVLRMILWDAIRLAGIGAAIGMIALSLAMQFIDRMLYGVSAFDPGTLVATAVLLTFVALTGALVPALRAASIDPIRALRAE